MATDDPGTPGKNQFELNLISDSDFSKDTNVFNQTIDLAIGLGESVQFRISKSYMETNVKGEPLQQGFEQTDIGVKWRFFDDMISGLKIAIFPSLRLNDATQQFNQDGSNIPRDGYSVYLPLIISKEVGDFTVVANVGYRKNLNDSTKDSIFTSMAVGHAVGEHGKVMAEFASELTGLRGSSSRRNDLRVGYAHVIFPHKFKDYQVLLFGSCGVSVGKTEDNQQHQTALFGISIHGKDR